MPASFLPPFRTFYDAYFKLGGSPSALTQAAQKWREFGNAAQTASDDLQAINNGEFLGSEGERYKKLVNTDFPDHLAITSRAHLGVADAIEEYATDLAARIRNMDHVESVARLHHTDVNVAAKAVNDAEFAVLAAPTLEAKAAAELALAAAWSDYNGKVTLWERDLDATDEIKRVLSSNVDTHTSTIKAQEKKAFEPNPNAAVQFWNNVKDFAHEHADILKKVAAALSFIGGILAAFTPVGWIVAAVAVGIMALLAASGAGSWLDVAVEVAFMTPIGVAGRVVGAGIKATSAGARMMNAGSKAFSAAKGTAGRVGKSVSEAATKQASRAMKQIKKILDPVDIATGAMIDQTTDIFIDGVLPLTMTRTAFSSHEVGRALGVRWVSTIDSRIEVNSDGVFMLAPSGAIVTFPPAPEDGSEVRAEGQPWLMSYGDGAYTVRDIQAGLTYSFRVADFGSAADEFRSGVADQSPSLGTSYVAAGIPTGSVADTFAMGIEIGISSVTHHTGHHIDFVWDQATGHITQIRRSDDTILYVDWDEAVGRVAHVSVSNPSTHPDQEPMQLIAYEYDPFGQLIRVINSGDGALSYRYDDQGRPYIWTDRNGVSYHYRFDEHGRVFAQVGTGGVYPNIVYYAPDQGIDAPEGGMVAVALETAGEFRGDPLVLGDSVIDDYFARLEQLPLYQALVDGGLEAAGLTGRGRTGVRDDEAWNIPAEWLHDDFLGDVRPTVYRSNAAGDVWRVITPKGSIEDTTFNGYHQKTSITNSAGATVTYTYNDDGVLIATEYPDGLETRIVPGSWGTPVRLIGRDGLITECEVDGFGMLKSVVDPAGATTTYAHEVRASGIVLASITSPNGAETIIECDNAGRSLASTDATGRRTSLTRDIRGLIVEAMDPIGATTTVSYTPEGWPTQVTNPDGTTVAATYDGEGNQIELINEIGAVTRTEYTVFDAPIATTDATGARTRFVYNTQMQPVRIINADDNIWSYVYDLDGMVTTEVDYNGIVSTQTVSPDGRVIVDTTPAGATTRTMRPDGLTDTITDGLGTTTYLYDEVTRLRAVVGPHARIDYRRDDFGRVLGETVTLTTGETTTHEYTVDHTGTIAAEHLLLPLGDAFATTFERDDSGAVVASHHGLEREGSTVSVADLYYGVDARGLRERVTTASVIRTIDTDIRGRTIGDSLVALDSTVAGGKRAVSTRTFDWRADSALSSMVDQLRGQITYGLDILGRATSVTRNAAGTSPLVLGTQDPDSTGMISADPRTEGTGTSGTYSANADTAAGVGAMHAERYGFSEAGVLSYLETSSNSSNSASRGAPRTATAVTSAGGSSVSASRATPDARIEFDGTKPVRIGRTTYTYDAFGRVIKTITKRISKKPLVHEFFYATSEQPIGFSSSDEPRVGYRYLYDPAGRRVAKERIDTTNGDVLTRTVFAHAGNQLVAEQTTISTVTGSTTPAGMQQQVGDGYVWTIDPGTGELTGQIQLERTRTIVDGGFSDVTAGNLAMVPGDPQSWSQEDIDARFMLIMTDLAGSPQELVDATSGTLVGRASQTLYGTRTWYGEVNSPLLYAGQYMDAESGWAYNRFRYYDPDAGSYNAQDPLGVAPRAASTQGYVDHAATWTDPLGLKACPWETKDTHVYIYRNQDKITYVGHTKHPRAREIAHAAMHPKTRPLNSMIVLTKEPGMLAKNHAKGVEQVLIEKIGMENPRLTSANRGPLENVINSISPKNSYYARATNFGNQWLTEHYPEMVRDTIRG